MEILNKENKNEKVLYNFTKEELNNWMLNHRDSINIFVNHNKNDFIGSYFKDFCYWNPDPLYFKEKIDKIKKINPNEVFSRIDDDFIQMEILKKALIKANIQLEKIRFDGLSTHLEGHALAFLIHKLLKLLKKIGINKKMNILENFFWTYYNKILNKVSESFNNIFEVLINSNFKKKEKKLILRAFYEEYRDNADLFIQENFILAYYSIYDYALEEYLEELKKEKKELYNNL